MKKTDHITEVFRQMPPLTVILGSTLLLCAAGFSAAKLFERITGGGMSAAGFAGIMGLAGFFASILFLMQKENPQ
ncbi:MAG: hypothetical protein Q4C58_09315 [Eubacteriales bacterium]|nr:hypothetical protein [Eubacteriales bacterium]